MSDMKLIMENWDNYSNQINEEQEINKLFNEHMQIFLENNPQLMSESVMDMAQNMPTWLKKVIIGAGLLTSLAGGPASAATPPPQEVAAKIVQTAKKQGVVDDLKIGLEDAESRIARGIEGIFKAMGRTAHATPAWKQAAAGGGDDLVAAAAETPAAAAAGAETTSAAPQTKKSLKDHGVRTIRLSIDGNKVSAKTEHGRATLNYTDVLKDILGDSYPSAEEIQSMSQKTGLSGEKAELLAAKHKLRTQHSDRDVQSLVRISVVNLAPQKLAAR